MKRKKTGSFEIKTELNDIERMKMRKYNKVIK